MTLEPYQVRELRGANVLPPKSDRKAADLPPSIMNLPPHLRMAALAASEGHRGGLPKTPADLDAQKVAVRKAVKKHRAATSRSRNVKTPADLQPGSRVQRAYAFLNERAGSWFTSEQVATALGEPKSHVSTGLSRMSRRGFIEVFKDNKAPGGKLAWWRVAP